MNPKKLLTVELKTWHIKGKYKVLPEKKNWINNKYFLRAEILKK